MVAGHCVATDFFKVFITGFNFFMPWFYYRSGMFYREQGIKESIKGNATKLLVPYVRYTIFAWLVASSLMLISGDYDWKHYALTPFKEILYVGAIQGNLVLWFLPTLFAAKIIFNYCLNHRISPYIIMVVSLFWGLIMYYTGNPIPPYITTTFTGLFFYSAGYLLKTKQELKYIPYVSIVVMVSFWVLGVSAVNMKDNDLLMGFYPLWFLFSVAGCTAINYLMKISPYSFPILRWVGVNSLVIYCTHWVFLDVERSIIGYGIGCIKADFYTLFCITMTIEVFIVYLMNKGKYKFNSLKQAKLV